MSVIINAINGQEQSDLAGAIKDASIILLDCENEDIYLATRKAVHGENGDRREVECVGKDGQKRWKAVCIANDPITIPEEPTVSGEEQLKIRITPTAGSQKGEELVELPDGEKLSDGYLSKQDQAKKSSSETDALTDPRINNPTQSGSNDSGIDSGINTTTQDGCDDKPNCKAKLQFSNISSNSTTIDMTTEGIHSPQSEALWKERRRENVIVTNSKPSATGGTPSITSTTNPLIMFAPSRNRLDDIPPIRSPSPKNTVFEKFKPLNKKPHFGSYHDVLSSFPNPPRLNTPSSPPEQNEVPLEQNTPSIPPPSPVVDDNANAEPAAGKNVSEVASPELPTISGPRPRPQIGKGKGMGKGKGKVMVSYSPILPAPVTTSLTITTQSVPIAVASQSVPITTEPQISNVVLPTTDMLDVTSPRSSVSDTSPSPVATSTPIVAAPQIITQTGTPVTRTFAIPRRLGRSNRPAFKMQIQGTFGEGGIQTKIWSLGYVIGVGNERVYMISIRDFNERRQKAGRGIRLFIPQWDILVSEHAAICEGFNTLRRGRKVANCLLLNNCFYMTLTSDVPYVDVRLHTSESIDAAPTNIGICITCGEWMDLYRNMYRISNELNLLRPHIMPPPLRYVAEQLHRC